MSTYVSRRARKSERKHAVRIRSRGARYAALHASYDARFAEVTGLRFIDLFAGAGGFSEGGEQAGATCVWAGNHWERAVEIHELNHPLAIHAQQDMHQADWHEVPRGVDLVLAGPSCQGHSEAGQPGRLASPEIQVRHDADRSTALAVINCLEVVRPSWTVTENVVAWLRWPLFKHWLAMLHELGYTTEILRLCADDYGSPQSRERVFVVGTLLGRAALDRVIAGIRARVVPSSERKTVASFARWDEGRWRPSESAGAKGSRQRIEEGLSLGVDQWWTQHVTGHKPKRIDVPLTTLTGADQHVLCRRLPGDRVEYRPLLKPELLAVQSFPSSYQLPPKINRRDMCRAIANAVDVSVSRAIVGAIGDARAA